jgi:hypothetical protein
MRFVLALLVALSTATVAEAQYLTDDQGGYLLDDAGGRLITGKVVSQYLTVTPKDGTIVKTGVTLTATSTRIVDVVILLGNTTRATCVQAIRCSMAISTLPKGTHTVTAVAVDRNGIKNVATTTISRP